MIVSMQNEVAHIFIDEFGTNAFVQGSSGTTSHFVYTSVIISESNLEKARQVKTALSDKYKQGAPLSSKRFDGRDKTLQNRINFIQDLVKELDFTIDILVIDKSKLDGAGLMKKKSFYKYFQGLLVNKYASRFESYHIYADHIGDDIFKRELKTYIDKKVAGDLFNPDRYFKLCDDVTEEPLIQIADMICGSLGKFYSSSHFHEKAGEIFELLHSRIICESFPSYESNNISKLETSDEVNSKIKSIAINSIKFDKASIADGELAERLVEYLFSHYKANPKRFVQTYELESYLKNFVIDIKIEKIRRLIRDLRYEGVFIISVSSQNGYKIAYDLDDIFQYFNHYSKYFIPMLKKIKIINQGLSIESFNDVNLIEKNEEFKLFEKLILAVDGK